MGVYYFKYPGIHDIGLPKYTLLIHVVGIVRAPSVRSCVTSPPSLTKPTRIGRIRPDPGSGRRIPATWHVPAHIPVFLSQKPSTGDGMLLFLARAGQRAA